jgi:hypothetical protein
VIAKHLIILRFLPTLLNKKGEIREQKERQHEPSPTESIQSATCLLIEGGREEQAYNSGLITCLGRLVVQNDLLRERQK